MPDDLGDIQNDKTVLDSVLRDSSGPNNPTRTSFSQETEPRLSMTSYGLSSAMQGIALYKPAGATYDIFNQELSGELENLGVETLFRVRDDKLNPYDVFVKAPDERTAGALNIDPASNPTTLPPGENNSDPAANVVIGAGGFAWPCDPRGVLTSPFGMRGGKLHAGIDIGIVSGSKLIAIKDGVLLHDDSDPGGYGQQVTVNHGGGVWSRYAHAREYIVPHNTKVKQGQVIALSGGGENDPGRGSSTGPHCHFEIHIDVPDGTAELRFAIRPVDPIPLIGEF